MTGDVAIRPMTPSDIAAVMALADSLPAAPRWPRETYEFALDPASRPQRIALVAEDRDGALAGFAVATRIETEAELESIAIAPRWQRQGVARRLFRRLAARLLDCGVEEVFLEVRISNQPARSLYVSLGFAEAGRRQGYYAAPPEDAVVLRLRLREAAPGSAAQT